VSAFVEKGHPPNYRCRASISLRAILTKTSSRSLPENRSLISAEVPEAKILPEWRNSIRSQTSSISFILCFACKIYKISLSGFVGLGEKYPEERKTLGDHIRATRLERGVLQREVAELIVVRRGTTNKWECNRGEPRAMDVPRILEFLGYDPLPEPACMEERMRVWRLRGGLSARAAARLIGVGEATWAAWERGSVRMSRKSRDVIQGTIGSKSC